jgi:hypothetical protein
MVLIGLYNHYARLATLARRWVFAHFGARAHILDRRLAKGRDTPQLQAWFRDQYRHPHETRHSISEVLRWFDANAVEFLGNLPRADGAPIAAAARLFEPQARRTRSRYLALKLDLLLRGGRDGGLFMMLGRKRG